NPSPRPKGKGEAVEDREALLWDLAGQEDYRLVHRLFLDETALALLLFNPQSNDPISDIDTWLKILYSAEQHQSFNLVKILVASRMDVGGLKVSQRKIDKFVKDK